MSLFMLETSAVDSASSSVQSLASQMRAIGSDVSGYDTNCEDGFDFSSAKSVIASNIESCAIKLDNIATLLETVSSAHTELQSSMKFSPQAESSTSNNSSSSKGGSSSSGGSRGSSSGGSGGYSSGGASGYSYGGSGGYSYGGSGGYSAGLGSAGGAVYVSANSVKEAVKEPVKKSDKATTPKLTGVGYASVGKDLDAESKKLFSSKAFSYDKGYGKLGNCFVIACDASIAKVNQLLKFTQKDGTVVYGVVGVNTQEKKNANKLHFIVDPNDSSLKKSIVCDTLISNNKKIEDCGNIYDIQKAAYVAKDISANNVNVNNNANTNANVNADANVNTNVNVNADANINTDVNINANASTSEPSIDGSQVSSNQEGELV